MKRRYDKKEDIPKGLESYYEENQGSFILKSIEGLKPIEDFVTIQKDLTEAKAKVNEFETKFGSIKDWDLKEVQAKLDKYEIYEKKKGTKTEDEAAIEAIKIRNAELEREVKRISDEHKIATESLSGLQKEKIKGLLKDKIRELVYNKEKQTYSVNEASIPVIEKVLDIDLEYNDTAKNFFTKDDKKIPLNDYLQQKAKEYGWYKGSVGDGDRGSGSGDKGSTATKFKSGVDIVRQALEDNAN